MDRRRVVEVGNSNGCVKSGSGCLLQKNLVLTARHILTVSQDATPLEGAKYRIRIMGDWQSGNTDWRVNGASLCWQSEKLDVALLKLEGESPRFLAETITDVKFGVLGTYEKFPAEGIGFPKAQYDKKKQDCVTLEGNLDKLQGERTGNLLFHCSPSCLTPNKPEAWKGISGTAIFVYNHLVGVVVQADGEEALKDALRVIPVSLLAEDQEFCKLVFGKEGTPPLNNLSNLEPPPENPPGLENKKLSSQQISDDLLRLIDELAKPPQRQFSETQLFKEFIDKFDTDYTSAQVGFLKLVQQECIKRISGYDKYELTPIGRQKLRQQ